MAARRKTNVASATRTVPVRSRSGRTRVMLACGVISSLLYAAMTAFIPMRWEGYSSSAQVVSELSAIGAPTRPLWVSLVTIYSLLYVAFGFGVLASAGANRRLRVAGGLIVVHGIFGLFWPPMHLRGAPFTMTDAMHIAFTVVTIALMSLTIGFGAMALGRRFRGYSVATIVIFVVFGALTAIDSQGIAKNLPTPWIGVWERINIAAFMLWVIVFAAAIMRRSAHQAKRL